MHTVTFALYREYLETTGSPAAAASLTLADTLQSSMDAAQKPKTTAPAGSILNLKQAAAYLGYAPAGLREIVGRTRRKQAGLHVLGPTIEYSQAGKRGTLLFRREWLDHFIEENRVRPNNSTLPKPHKRGRPNKADERQREMEAWDRLCAR